MFVKLQAKKMTKRIRIENADTAPFAVCVQVFEAAYDEEDVLVAEQFIVNPCDIAEFDLMPSRYLVITETPTTAAIADADDDIPTE